MKRYLVSIFTGALLTQLSAQTPVEVSTQRINPAQADAIIETQQAAKEAERQSKRQNFHVLQRRKMDLGDRSLILERVAKPNLPQRPPKPTPVAQTPAEQAAMLEEYENTVWISLSAVVYDNYGVPITHLRWQYDGNSYEAWSEADFTYFRTVPEFSVEGKQYRIAMTIFNESVEEMDKRKRAALADGMILNLPEIPTLPTTDEMMSEYFVVSDDPSIFENEEAFTPIDDAHQYYDANLDELQVRLANRKALNAAQKRHEATNPKSKDTTLTYWIEK